jgi:uncharacterized membrane protein
VLGYLYPYIKFVHVLLAIVAVGFNASYGVWLTRATREPAHLGHVLRGIKVLDDRFANPAYGLLLITGLANVFIAGIPLTTPWIAGALALWLVLIVVGAAVYSPTLRKQIAALETAGPDSAEYRTLAARGRTVGIALAVIVVVIVFLMVVKPGA